MLQIFVGHLVSSVSYRTGYIYVCAARLLRTDLGETELLVATPRFVVSDRPSFQKSPSIRFELGHSESHGALPLSVEPCQLCQGYASLDSLRYGFVWLLTHERFSALSLASIATVQASIPQSGPRLCFGATPLVPCPFAFQPNPDSVRCVAEQTLNGVYL